MKTGGSDDRYERSRRLAGIRTYPTQHERDLAYLKVHEQALVPDGALVLGFNPQNGRGVYFLPEDLATHLHILGGSETGKTNCLKHLASALMAHRDRTGEGFSVIDPAGPLATHVLDLCAARGEAFASNVVYFSLRDSSHVPIFNPLRPDRGIAFTAHGFVEAVARVRGVEKTSETPTITEILYKTVKVLLHNRLSLAEAGFFIAHSDQYLGVREHLLEHVKQEPELVSFWRDEIGKLRAEVRRKEISPAARRFEQILDFPPVKTIVGQTSAGIDLAEVMDEGHIGIFDLGLDRTDLTSEATQLVGALLVQEFKAVTMRRIPNESKPHYLIIDEFSDFVSHDVMTVFDRARQYGLRVILAHQGLDQLLLRDEDPRLLKAILRVRQKLIFGAGLVDDQLALARQAFAPWIDTEKRRLEIRTKTPWPIPKKVILGGGSETDSDGNTYQPGMRGGSTTYPGAELNPIRAESFSDPLGPTTNRGRATQTTWHEQYVTSFEEREQLTSVQFDEPENQLFKTMQNLYRQPAGACSVVTGKNEPQLCQMELVPKTTISEVTRRRFLAAVFSKPIYLRTEEAQRQIQSRHQKLLEAAAPEIESSKGASRRRNVVSDGEPRGRGRVAATETGSPMSVAELVSEWDLVQRYRKVGLPRPDHLIENLRDAHQFFGRENWKESMANSRLALERVLSDVAERYSEQTNGTLRRDPSAMAVRDCLIQLGILDETTRRMLGGVYSFQSGALHPQESPATSEKARLSLDLTKSFGVFVLERFEAKLASDRT